MNAKTSIAAFCAVAAWVLAVTLVVHLLSGDFDTRDCRTGCTQAIYWASFGLAAVAAAFMRKTARSAFAVTAPASAAALLVIYLVMMAIGGFA